MRTLGLIPARGGSKGVPRKNIRLLCGKPLLQYTVEPALGARMLSRVVLSTEDKEIAEVGRRCGVEVPFMRPADLAADTAPTLPVVVHAIRWLEDHGDRFDAVCILQPTNPFRTSGDIDGCIQLLETTGADSVVSVLPVPAEHNPHWVFFRDKDGYLQLSTGEPRPIPRRQDLPPAFFRDGSVYVSRRIVVMEKDSLYGERTVGFLGDPARSLNIDTMSDWDRAEGLMDDRSVSGISRRV